MKIFRQLDPVPSVEVVDQVAQRMAVLDRDLGLKRRGEEHREKEWECSFRHIPPKDAVILLGSPCTLRPP
jgi:hypothetical protein